MSTNVYIISRYCEYDHAIMNLSIVYLYAFARFNIKSSTASVYLPSLISWFLNSLSAYISMLT